MESHSANISASHTEGVLKEGMEVKCKESMEEGYTYGKWYKLFMDDGDLLIASNHSNAAFECWTIGTQKWQLESSNRFFDLTNPRYPEKKEEKPRTWTDEDMWQCWIMACGNVDVHEVESFKEWLEQYKSQSPNPTA